MKHCIIHYSGEIGSKGKNRGFFEKKLRDNVRCSIKKDNYESIRVSNSRIVIRLKEASDNKEIEARLRRVAGISFFSFAYACEPTISRIAECIAASYKNHGKYKIQLAVPNKGPGITPEELYKCLRQAQNADADRLFIEVLDCGCFIYDRRIEGLGGLPVGSAGKLIALVSGGIDSPVAAFKMFRRGCSVSFVHFSNPTQDKESVRDKVLQLAAILSIYQFKTRLYIIRFDEIQRSIIASIPADVRMIVYRRMMFKIAERIAEREGAKGFVTGDSLSQVASQTLDNIGVIYRAASYPVFSPLIGDDKETIIRLAKVLGTYSISILPYNDCCSFLVAEHPRTRVELGYIEKLEQKLLASNIDRLIGEAVRDAEVRVFVN